MQITRSSAEGTNATTKGPAEWFTSDVYIDPVAASPAPSQVLANLVHFTPGARTAWHSHPLGQSLFVTEGIGLCQRRGGPIEVIRPGDRVYIEPREEHWRGATPGRPFGAPTVCSEVGLGFEGVRVAAALDVDP